jgi:hypothetical protein
MQKLLFRLEKVYKNGLRTSFDSPPKGRFLVKNTKTDGRIWLDFPKM